MKKLIPARKSWQDYALWPLLKVLWEPFSIKRSHFWHWHDFCDQAKTSLTIEADKNAKDRKSIFSNLWQSNFGWRHAAIVEPVKDGQIFTGHYHVGYKNPATGKNEICVLVLSGQTAVLKGHANIRFFAIDAETGESISLQLVDEMAKNDLPKNIPLI